MPKTQVEEKDYTKYLDKEATDLQHRFTEWLQGDSVGYNPATAKSKAESFAEGVRLATALRMEFQRSPENQAQLEESRAAKEAAKAATAAKPKRQTRAAKAKVEEPEPEEVEEEVEEDTEEEEVEEAPKPARRARATAKTKAATAPASRPAPRRTRAKTGSAPF